MWGSAQGRAKITQNPVTHTRAGKMGTIVPYRPQTMEVGPQILRLLFITRRRLRLWRDRSEMQA